MATHPMMLLAYDAAGEVVATLDYLVQYDPDGHPAGLADFAKHEEAGAEHTDIWAIDQAKGSKVWPEWIGGRAHDFKVELDGPAGQKRIVALVHKTSGHRRVRADVEAAIQGRIDEKTASATAAGKALRATIAAQEKAAKIRVKDRVAGLIPDPTPEPADIRDLVGGPDRPLLLDDEGRTMARPVALSDLPLIGISAPPSTESAAVPPAPRPPAKR